MSKKFATIVSRVFDPFISLGAVFVLLFLDSPAFIEAFFFMVVLPFILFFIAWKTKFISNWDVSERRQRPKILWALIGIEIVSSVLLRSTAAVPVIAALVGFAIITQFWKISGHTVTAALATGIVVYRLGLMWWPVLLIVPIIGWARVVTKNHTVGQVVVGAIYAWSLVYIFSFF